MQQAVEGVFKCPSNTYKADPFQSEAGTFEQQQMTSYNTFRSFMMWSRTMVNWNPSEPWGERAPVPEASFDTVGGKTLTPQNYRPHIDRVANPAGKVYLADANRFTDESGKITYDIDWDAENGGAFCNGGPTLPEWGESPPSSGGGPQYVLSSYHPDEQLGKIGYRHHAAGERGIVVNFFDGHSEFLTETQSRHPRYFWPKGTKIPFPELNEESQKQISIQMLDDDFNYVVGN